MGRSEIVILSVFFLLVSSSIVLFNGTWDLFFPKNLSYAVETIEKGSLLETEGISLYYYFIAELILIMNISVYAILYIPFLLPIYITVFYSLINKYVCNKIMSLMIVLIMVFTGLTGTSSHLLWPHSVGSIVFFSIIIVLINLYYSKSSGNIICITIFITSIIYMNYNYTDQTIILLFVLSIIAFVFSRRETNQDYTAMTYSLFIAVIILFSFSNFFLDTYLPLILNTEYIEHDTIEKTFSRFLDGPYINYPLNLIYYTENSQNLIIMNFIKYILLGFGLVVNICLMLKYKLISLNLDKTSIVIISLAVTSIIFVFQQLLIGGGSIIGIIFTQSMFSFYIIMRRSKKHRKYVHVTLTILFLITVSIVGLNIIEDRYNAFDGYYLDEYRSLNLFIENNDRIISTEELSMGFMKLTSYDVNVEKQSKYRMFNSSELEHLLGIYDNEINRTFLINAGFNQSSIHNWIIIKNWNYNIQMVNTNPWVNKYYSASNLMLYE